MVSPPLALTLIAIVETSDSEDHFSDAKSAPVSPARSSPVPRTRIEKVDNEPSHGEVPGTEAHRQREEDAKPDEIAVPPDSTSPGPSEDSPNSGLSSGSLTAPQTVVSESAGPTGPHTEEFIERIEEAHRADATPDVVMQADDAADKVEDADRSPVEPSVYSPPPGDMQDLRNDGADEEEDEGDDFDEFEEGAEDDDFDDFEDGFQQAESTAPVAHDLPPPAAASQPTTSLPFVGHFCSCLASHHADASP